MFTLVPSLGALLQGFVVTVKYYSFNSVIIELRQIELVQHPD